MKIGILGGGQLGMMLAQAGVKLSHSFRCYDPDPNAPAHVAAECIHEDYHDFEALHRFADGLDVITYEFENVPHDAVAFVMERAPVHPSLSALHVAQERIVEKEFLRARGIPVAEFAAADSEKELLRVAELVGFPCVVKTCRFGYDGKGQVVLRSNADIPPAWEAIGGTPLIIEAFVPFQRELSIIAARSQSGEIEFYPLVENMHREGILRRTIAPAPAVSEALQRCAEEHIRAVMEELNYVGVLTIEFFEADGKLIANEMAPRVHNSGHWTIEGAQTSQFESHIRAITSSPLGSTAMDGVAAMLNIIGEEPAYAALADVPGVHVHSYGKAPRAKRKLGHITVLAETHEELHQKLHAVESRFGK